MNTHFLSYFESRLRMIRNSIRFGSGTLLKGAILPFFFLFVSVFMFIFVRKAFRFFNGFELIGEFVIVKLLSLIFFIFFMFLVLSNVNSIVKWFLTKDDLPFLLTSPLSSSTIFFVRSIEALFESSWAFLFFSIPVLLAYYTALFKFKIAFLLSLLLLVPYAVIPYGLAFMLVMLMARFLSPKVIKRTFSFLFVLLTAGLVITFQTMEIEKLARPEAFGYLYEYMRYLSVPAHPLLPTGLFIESVVFLAKHESPNILLDAGCFLLTPLALLTLAYWISERFYRRGYANMRSSSGRVRGNRQSRVFRFLPARTRNLFLKEMKNLKRDPKEWSQVLLIFALVFVYVYNFKSFPRDRTALPTVFLESLLCFLNMGLLTFVISAVSVRFIYPSFQLEGRSFWVILTSPIRVGEVYRRKLAFYLPLTLSLALSLNYLSNYYIASPAFLHYISFGYITLVSIASPITAFYFGTRQMNLNEPPNPYGGLGGILTMLAIIGYTVVSLGLLGWVSYPILLVWQSRLPIPLHLTARFALATMLLLGVTLVSLHVLRVKTIENLEKIEL